MSSHPIDISRRTFGGSIWLKRLGWALAGVWWLSCGMVWAGTLQATAIYRERIALPPDAVLAAELQDISRAGAPAVVIGRSRLDPAGQPPFRFAIAYDDAAVHPGHRYTVRVTITHQGRLLFTTDRIHPVLDGDRLGFERMASTMMSCLDGMDQEQRFFEALAHVALYRIHAKRLELLDGEGAVILQFESEVPR